MESPCDLQSLAWLTRVSVPRLRHFGVVGDPGDSHQGRRAPSQINVESTFSDFQLEQQQLTSQDVQVLPSQRSGHGAHCYLQQQQPRISSSSSSSFISFPVQHQQHHQQHHQQQQHHQHHQQHHHHHQQQYQQQDQHRQ
ncbi:unnamed protein product, partial [Lampetra fluviatilis]